MAGQSGMEADLTRDLLFLGVEEEDLFKTKYSLTASEDEDGSDDERKHQKLLEAISSLGDKKRKKKTERTEASLQISEFTVSSEGTNEKIELSDLVGNIQPSSSSLNKVKKQLTKFEKTNKPLDLPLNKQQSEKIQRTLAYEKTTKEITRWDHVVRQNRKAEQLTFPLNKEQLTVKPVEEVMANWKARTPLEQEVFNLLHKNKQPVTMPFVTAREQASMRAMCLEEARERRAELQKARALQSYYEARTKRAKKIKSKKFHKIVKRVKQKEILKKFEELRKTDPEAALEELNKMEQMRMEERMSLRHQNSGKWAKSKVIMAKYDNEARNAIQKQLEKNKMLTTKVVPQSESEDEVETEVDKDETVPDFVNDVQMGTTANPWMLGKLSTDPINLEADKPQITTAADVKLDDSEESDEQENLSEDEKLLQEFEERRKIRKEHEGAQTVKVDAKGANNINNKKEKKSIVSNGQNEKEKHLENDEGEFNKLFQTLVKNKSQPLSSRAKRNQTKSKKKRTEKKVEDVQIPEEKDEPLLNEQLERKKTVEEFDALGQDEQHELTVKTALSTSHISNSAEESENKSDTKTEVKKDNIINPNSVLMLTSKTIDVPLLPSAIEEENEDQEDQRMIIKEAFASDDVIGDFMKDKQREINATKPKHIDLTLPGWGEWGGQGLRPSAKKRRRFRIRAPPALPRKDQNLPNVIISEKRDIEAAAHQVNELPFPFANRHQFEKSICAPLGNTWNTEKAARRLNSPKIVTKLGAIIEPIAEEDVFHDKKMCWKSNKEQNPHKRIKRQQKNTSHRR